MITIHCIQIQWLSKCGLTGQHISSSDATHICVRNLTIIGSDNGLSPERQQAIIWTNAGILLIGPLGTKFSEILIEIHTSSFKKMYLKMSAAKMAAILYRPQCVKDLPTRVAIELYDPDVMAHMTAMIMAWLLEWQITISIRLLSNTITSHNGHNHSPDCTQL